jgi:hypothetical protein
MMDARHLAQGLSSLGRGSDTSLVHMTPSEVQSLQSLAEQQGGSLSINPETGLPEAGFLRNLLPTIAGIGLGALFPGLSPMMIPLITGAGNLALGDKQQSPLMRFGLGALGGYGGSSLVGGLRTAGTMASGSVAQSPTEALASYMPNTIRRGLTEAAASPSTFVKTFSPFSDAPKFLTGPSGALISGGAAIAPSLMAPQNMPINLGSGKPMTEEEYYAWKRRQASMNRAQLYPGTSTGQTGLLGREQRYFNPIRYNPLSYANQGGVVSLQTGGVVPPYTPATGYERTFGSIDQPQFQKSTPFVSGVGLGREAAHNLPQHQFLPFVEPTSAPASPLVPTELAIAIEEELRRNAPGLDDFDGDMYSGVQTFGHSPEHALADVGLAAAQADAAAAAAEANAYTAIADMGAVGGNEFSGVGGAEGQDDTSDTSDTAGASGSWTASGGLISLRDGGIVESTVQGIRNRPAWEMGKLAATFAPFPVGPVLGIASLAAQAFQTPRDEIEAFEEQQAKDVLTARGVIEESMLASPYGHLTPEEQEELSGAPAGFVDEYGSMSDAIGGAPGADGTSDIGDVAGIGGIADIDDPSAVGGEGEYAGGLISLMHGGLVPDYAGGGLLAGRGDGMSDSIHGSIEGVRPARLADGEFVVPADVVAHLGNGSTNAGAKQLYGMMDRVRDARTNSTKQAPAVNPRRMMPV